jgi:hypothetical protein
VIALVPLLGAIALGGEAASWYVTKQHAQNAADAAAYSGGLALACSIAGSSSCSDAHDYVYRGKEFAAQNSFCNSGDTSYPGSACTTSLPMGTSQSVTIVMLTSWNGNNGNFVKATVTQTQPGYLAAVIGLSTVNIGAQAIANVNDVKQICGLGLSKTGSALTLGGSVNLAGTGCGLMSDSKVNLNSAPTVSGSNWAVYGTSGCGPGACPDPGMPYNYYSPPAANPLSSLNSASFSLANGTQTSCGSKCTVMNPGSYSSKLTVTGNDVYHFTPGVYIFSKDISIIGGTVDCPTCTCVGSPTAITGTSGVNIVITGSAKLTINTATVSLCAGTNNTGIYSGLNGVLIDDQATGAVSVSGGGTVGLDGAVYAPKTDVTWGGTTSFANNTCSEVIGKTLTLTGSAYMSVSNCVSGTVPYTQLVALVQ